MLLELAEELTSLLLRLLPIDTDGNGLCELYYLYYTGYWKKGVIPEASEEASVFNIQVTAPGAFATLADVGAMRPGMMPETVSRAWMPPWWPRIALHASP